MLVASAQPTDDSVNTAIAAFYYLNIAKAMWFDPAPDGDVSPVRIPISLRTAMFITVVATMVFGILPGILSNAAQALVVIYALICLPRKITINQKQLTLADFLE